MKIDLQIALKQPPRDAIPRPEDFQHWGDAAIQDDVEVCVRIVEEDESAELNRRYRQGSASTNVLAFPFESPLAERTNYLGDIVIAAPLAAAEARQQGKDLKSHWAHLFVHGLLHLRGYDHQDDEAASKMQARETNILNSLGFADPYSSTSESVNE